MNASAPPPHQPAVAAVRPTSPPVRAVAVRVGSLLALVAALVLLPGFTDSDALKAVIPLFCVLLYLQLAPLIWPPRADIFSPVAFNGLMGSLATTATLATFLTANDVEIGALIRGLAPSEAQALAEKVLWASILGLSCFYVGYYARFGIPTKSWFPNVARLEWNPGRLRLLSGLALIIFIVAYGAFQSRLGVSLSDLTQLGAGKAVWRDDPRLSWILRGVQFCFLPVLFYITWGASRRGKAPLIASALLLVVASALVARMGQRGMFMYVFLCVLVLVHYLRVRIPVAVFAGLLFSAIVLSNLLYEVRTQVRTGDATLRTRASNPVAALVSHESERQRFSANALILREFPDHHPYLLGESWLGMLAAPIPRWVWPAKVEHFAWRDTRIVDKLGGGPIPASFLGTLYANFSWIGIILGMLVWGAVQRGMYEWLLEHPSDKSTVLLYTVLLIFFGPTLLQLSSTMQYVIPIWLGLRFIGTRRPPGAERTPVLAPTPAPG